MLTWGVNRSFFLALGVMLGLGGTGGFCLVWRVPQGRLFVLYLRRLDQLRQPSLHGASIKIVLAGGRDRDAWARTPLTGAPNG